MASKKTVTLHNLEALGGERLAEILVDRRLRLELAAQAGGDSIAADRQTHHRFVGTTDLSFAWSCLDFRGIRNVSLVVRAVSKE